MCDLVFISYILKWFNLPFSRLCYKCVSVPQTYNNSKTHVSHEHLSTDVHSLNVIFRQTLDWMRQVFLVFVPLIAIFLAPLSQCVVYITKVRSVNNLVEYSNAAFLGNPPESLKRARNYLDHLLDTLLSNSERHVKNYQEL